MYGLQIVGEIASYVGAYGTILEINPDIVILDFSMPGMRGLATLNQIKIGAPNISIVAVSEYRQDHYVASILKSGVKGHILRNAAKNEYCNAISTVSRGKIYAGTSFSANSSSTDNVQDSSIKNNIKSPTLSERETVVLRMISLGLTNKNVALSLGVTANTIDTHKRRASEKLEIYSRAKLVQYAIFNGWLGRPIQEDALAVKIA
ncbi:DNA-binding NarL/FixJ family response regulator [Methylobacterium brachythecii]|uniref:DNA-binding NarL/FixJ family response regulator n=2 Tax=Methylobacterium brachythecii TaxID=1176177 RepID=A0A7W6AL38_9HYPH|nr:DNA-binding NarL/FixJ family response regulator [Methylobacterium brachythecii]GLS42605.1 DNA-binding response regulator [Methylobacterium brachythecii]